MAILNYKDHKYIHKIDHIQNPPNTTRQCGEGHEPCKVLNCKTPEKDIDPLYNIKCLYINEMKGLPFPEEDDRETVPMFGSKNEGFNRDNEIFITFSLEQENKGHMSLNGFKFIHPPVSSLTQHHDIDPKIRCNGTACVKIFNGNGSWTWPDSCKCYNEVNKVLYNFNHIL